MAAQTRSCRRLRDDAQPVDCERVATRRATDDALLVEDLLHLNEDELVLSVADDLPIRLVVRLCTVLVRSSEVSVPPPSPSRRKLGPMASKAYSSGM